MQHGDRLAGVMDHLAALDVGGQDAQDRQSGRHRAAQNGKPRLLTLPVALRSAVVRVRASAVWGAAVLVVLVLAVVGVRSSWAQRVAEPTPVPISAADHDAAVPTGPEPDGVTAVDSGVGSSRKEPGPRLSEPTGGLRAAAPVYVHVVGAVRESGVVEVPAGSRVSDVVESAGGLSADADPSRINLARLVVDGERIWVPVLDEEPPEEVAASMTSSGSGGTSGDAGTGADGGTTSGVVDVNTADSAALQTLPGVGPVTAESILAWRTEHGRFATIEELMEVRGIGPRTLDQLKPLVVVGP